MTEEELKAIDRADKRVKRWAAIGLIVIALAPGGYAAWTWKQAKWPGQRWFEKSTKQAKAWSADAELISIYGNAVDPTGFADVRHSGAWRFEFRSPSREAEARRTPSAPIPGAPPAGPVGPQCRFSYEITHGTQGGFMAFARKNYLSDEDDGCGISRPDPVHCTITQVWDRAAAQGAPRPGYAIIRLKTTTTGRVWSFEIPNLVDQHAIKPIFKTSFADDCSPG